MDTWDLLKGDEIEPKAVIDMIKEAKFIDGVTLSGGDPFMQPMDAARIAKKCRDMGLNVWCYTGYTYEEIVDGRAKEGALDLLTYIDVLVDGRFEIEKRSDECLYRGSFNQRLIDVNKSRASGYVIECKF